MEQKTSKGFSRKFKLAVTASCIGRERKESVLVNGYLADHQQYVFQLQPCKLTSKNGDGRHQTGQLSKRRDVPFCGRALASEENGQRDELRVAGMSARASQRCAPAAGLGAGSARLRRGSCSWGGPPRRSPGEPSHGGTAEQAWSGPSAAALCLPAAQPL